MLQTYSFVVFIFVLKETDLFKMEQKCIRTSNAVDPCILYHFGSSKILERDYDEYMNISNKWKRAPQGG